MLLVVVQEGGDVVPAGARAQVPVGDVAVPVTSDMHQPPGLLNSQGLVNKE